MQSIVWVSIVGPGASSPTDLACSASEVSWVRCALRNEEVRECQLSLSEEQEVEGFLEHCKAHFRRVGGDKTAEQKAAHKKVLLESLKGQTSNIDQSMLDAATDIMMVETIPLLSNMPDNGFVSVSLYCDDTAAIKGLPTNVRASGVAQECGKLLDVKGDCFVARIMDNEEDFKRLDFRLSELNSSAAWVREARDQTQRKAQGGDRTQAFLEKVQNRKPQVRELTPAESEKEDGNKAFKNGDWVLAAEHYTAAVKLDGSLTAAYNNRALCYIKLGRWKDAEMDCDVVLSIEPKNCKALLRRSCAREGQGLLEGALADAQAVLELQANNREAQEIVQRVGSGQPSGQ